MAKITVRQPITNEDGDIISHKEVTVEINDLSSIVITLDNGKELELSHVTNNKKSDSIFVNGFMEQQIVIKPFIQGGILVIPE